MADRPLEGRRIVVTRPREQSASLVAELGRLGAAASAVPLIEIEPLDDVETMEAARRRISGYDWLIVTSANTVAAMDVPELSSLVEHVRVAAVGPATAAALRGAGIEPDFVPARFAAEEIVAGLEPVAGFRVLLPQADIADGALADELRRQGAEVDIVAAYRTVEREPSAAETRELRLAEAVVVASGSAARSLARAGVGEATFVVCIGPKTAAAAEEAGLRVGLVSDEASADGIIRALVSHFGESS